MGLSSGRALEELSLDGFTAIGCFSVVGSVDDGVADRTGDVFRATTGHRNEPQGLAADQYGESQSFTDAGKLSSLGLI